MRHTESPERSAELLRQAIPLMGQHGGVYHPPHYALWYEYLSGTHGALRSALDERLAGPRPLTAGECEELYTQHLGKREAIQTERLQQGLQLLLEQLGAVARSAGVEAVEFQQQLSATAERLTGGLDAPTVGDLVSELAAHARTLQGAASRLHQRVTDAGAEIATLREQLGQVRSEALHDQMTRLLNRRGFEAALAALCSRRADRATWAARFSSPTSINSSASTTTTDICSGARSSAASPMCSTKRSAAATSPHASAVRNHHRPARYGARGCALGRREHPGGRHALPAQARRVRCRSLTASRCPSASRARRPGEPLDKVIERADQAMLQAKQSGRNRVNG